MIEYAALGVSNDSYVALAFFLVRPTQSEREAAEMVAGAAAKAEKEAYFSALPGKMAAEKAARAQMKADKKGM